MARKKSKTLTDGELRIMEVVWRLQTASVKQVADSLRQSGEIAYNTVQTMMGILANKGYLSRHKEGRAFVYEPLVTRRAARSEALQHLTRQFFGGSQRDLLHNLVEDEAVDAGEIEALRELLRSAQSRREADGAGEAAGDRRKAGRASGGDTEEPS